jgi:hypothetical protein
MENPPVTDRAAELDPRLAIVEISSKERSRFAAVDNAKAAAAKPDEEDPSPILEGNEFVLSSFTW